MNKENIVKNECRQINLETLHQLSDLNYKVTFDINPNCPPFLVFIDAVHTEECDTESRDHWMILGTETFKNVHCDVR